LGYLKGHIARIIERIVIKLSRKIIVHSLKTKKELIRCGVKEKDIRVIPNGIDLKIIEDIPPSKENSDLIFSGRLIKDKNVDILVKSVFLVKREIENIKCLIIGEGPEKEELVELVDRLNLRGNIDFKGFLEYEKMISYMKASKIFVFPSTREGFGIAVMEAMACRIPPITVEHIMNAATELIRDGENGFICRLNEADICQKILLLLKDENLRVKMGERAFCYVKDYDWDIITDEIEKFYNCLLVKSRF
jgi:glycosyltransferase involved in cell wall biosynthesis